MSLVYKTIYISLLIQIITTIITLRGVKYKLKPEDQVLKETLNLENIVQIIEALMYFWIALSVSDLENITNRRYLDWFITTPIMLLSTSVFMKYNSEKNKNNNKKITLKQFMKDNFYTIMKIVVLNFLMLLFGYLGEKKIINKNFSILIGFIFFFGTFKIIHDNYVDKNITNRNLFYGIFFIWSLYGIAALLNDTAKNISYNFLDIISKNFYGLFLFYKILKIKVN